MSNFNREDFLIQIEDELVKKFGERNVTEHGDGQHVALSNGTVATVSVYGDKHNDIVLTLPNGNSEVVLATTFTEKIIVPEHIAKFVYEYGLLFGVE